MAIRQLVLIECEGSHQTPRMRVKSDYRAVHVTKVGEGEKVFLDFFDGPQTESFEVPVGSSPFPTTRASHFAVRKVGGQKSLPTTMEISHVTA